MISFLWRKEVLLILALANGLGSIYGYYWYHHQLAVSPWYLWPVIPDSPLSASLFTLFLIFLIWKINLPWLFLLANLMMIKYGLWAVIINLDVYWSGHSFAWENLHLTLSHAVMALQGILFLRKIRFAFSDYFIASGWLILNDFIDYFWQTHPYLFYAEQITIAQTTASLLTGIVIIYAAKRLIAVQ
ncbi:MULTISPECIES: DUF1405 domain-containing protein [Carboxydocella]|uniref:Uncharacterized membrane protein YpjA n=2 Tax=Carboxydocella TaxID=178898 RepID=A0A1T4LUH7_9FIRM|nr:MULTISPECIES: DUF1405 domain-containing protein [Carboxydocella]AVX20619.1 putative membrane protein YpjA [Carboxydocella thermautotrophica]AVX31041.1 putative membrane protein YpjA [Carboxydocella thermautotrophica]GAW31547.1 hypothetical protein JDF658_13120 [Carboxydocella sp. JDF658]SJZ58352.1 Uncharacterized membrane protein YpjA [Carboxydocella sporoproducens DSM 16521]